MNGVKKTVLIFCLALVMGLGGFSAIAFAAGDFSAQEGAGTGNYAVLVKNGDALDAGGQAYTLTFKYGQVPSASGDIVEVYDGASFENGFTEQGRQPWARNARSITRVVFDASVNGHLSPASTAFWFQDLGSLKQFEGSANLNTSNVRNMRDMFWGCASLITLDLSTWNTSLVGDMQEMFQGCTSLTQLKMNVAHVTNAERMFESCSSLSTLDTSTWNLSQATSLSRMFYGCESLQSLSTTSWNVFNAVNLGYMFHNCSSLTSLNLSSWNTSKVESTLSMFGNCSSLSYLDVSSWNTSSMSNMLDMFAGCYALSQIKLGPQFSFKGMGTLFEANRALLPERSEDGKDRYAWHRDGSPDLYLTPDLRDNYNGSTMAGLWKREVAYYVEYDLNKGTGSIPKQIVKKGDWVKVASGSSLTRSGFRFTGWNEDLNGTGKAYSGGETLTPTSDITLHAQWTAVVPDSGGDSGGSGESGGSGGSGGSGEIPDGHDVVIETAAMYRLYNPNSGEHFYTASNDERLNLINLGWIYEGIGWLAPKESNVPVYRLYNANGGEHHYTMSESERNSLISIGWNDEGIGWYSADEQGRVLYREYNPNAYANNHNYTTDISEHANLISLGWRDEGTAWYGLY